MSIMISSEVSKQYLFTEDAVEGFRLAVENGQTRLALQVLVDVIDGIMEIFDSAFEEEEETEPKVENKIEPIPVVQEEEKKETPKKTVKEKTEDTVAP